MVPPIKLEYHDPSWAVEFQHAKNKLEVILSGIPVIEIEHVGSTAIPDLIAKPVIDVDIVITPEYLDVTKEALLTAGYIWIGESGIDGRHAFWQPNTLETRGIPSDGSRRYNTYVIFEGCNCLRGHRDLKRILLSDPELRKEYGAQKVWLVYELGVYDIEEYSALKNDVVLKILRKAGWTDKDLAERREVKLREVIEWDGKMDKGFEDERWGNTKV